MKKIKLFLGAYIDSVNAQDINCFNIAKFIDKKLFEVHTLIFNKEVNIRGVICHKIGSDRIKKNFDKLKIMQTVDADLYYLPRVEKIDILFAKISNKKIVSSVEIQTVYKNKLYKKFFNTYITNYFCISKFLNEENKRNWNKSVDVIYLGVDTSPEIIERKFLKNIVFVGSIVERKRPWIFLRLAKEIPELHFIMIGDGDLFQSIRKQSIHNRLTNIEFTGKLTNTEVLEKLKQCDLLVMTSQYEGLPKVVLEAASKCVPTIYISQFYKIDYIKSGVNGFEARNIEDIKQVIYHLMEDKELYKNICEKSYEISNKYSWEKLIKQYEKFFIKTLKNKE